MVYVLDARQAKFGARETNQQLCDGYQFHQNDSGTELRIAKKKLGVFCSTVLDFQNFVQSVAVLNMIFKCFKTWEPVLR